MPAPDRPTFPTRLDGVVVQLTDDGSRTLIHTDTQHAFHSGSGALTETRHVYLDNSGVADRLRGGLATSVLEVGLGTGMGMLMTVDAARHSSTGLQYVGFENQWLPADVLQQLQPQHWVRRPELVNQFLDFRRQLPERVDQGVYTWHAGDKQSVTIHHTDVLQFEFPQESQFDAIYFDPFAPQANRELWQREMFWKLHQCLRGGGRLVTYCVSRSVRETLVEIGFDVQRVTGPAGGKREVMIAFRQS